MANSNLLSFTDSRSARATHPRAKPLVFADIGTERLLKQVERLAPSDASVLIIGESGTGKELMARRLHAQSDRSGPFIAVNCAALSASLVEAELFGHEAGAYTGATGARAGWFEAADGGTLFLDEVADLPPAVQVKILRVLQEREVVRVGSRKATAIDVRLVAATNVDLESAVADGRFRLDLFYRLNVASITLPPLRARIADILPLTDHFLKVYSERLQVPVPSLPPETQRALLGYHWPGNIRELENVVHFALLTATEGVIRPQDLRFASIRVPSMTPTVSATPAPAPQAETSPVDDLIAPLDRLFRSPTPDLLPKLEEMIVRRAFEYCGGNQVHSAKLLGISRNVLRTHLKRFGLIADNVTATVT
jgi:sigma-54-specific transcriptional regulator